tara:strand:- start:381 stop:1109 length:729 start_codon:yes stop_codon:yes gene_type:complete
MKLFILFLSIFICGFGVKHILVSYDLHPILNLGILIFFYIGVLLIATRFNRLMFLELFIIKPITSSNLILLGLTGCLCLVLIGCSLVGIFIHLDPQGFTKALSDFNISILFTFLIGALFEEILFRKYLISKLAKRYSPTKAVFLSAIIFSLFHFIDGANLILLYFMGLILGYVYWISKSWLLVFVIHFSYNLTLLLVDYSVIHGSQLLYLDLPYYLVSISSSILLLWYSLFLLKSKVKQLET